MDFHAMNYLFPNKELFPIDEKFEVTELTNRIKNSLLGEV